MKRYIVLLCLVSLTVFPLGLAGCARAARNTQGFAMVDRTEVDAPLAQAWQNTKSVLREMGLDIYTRDKRGVFVAYSAMNRRWLVPGRTQYTISLSEKTADTTTVTVETVDQVYGVTLLTYPGWHDRKTTDNSVALSILQAIHSKASGSAQAAPGSPPSK